MHIIKIVNILLFVSLFIALSTPLFAGKRSIEELSDDEFELVVDEDYDPAAYVMRAHDDVEPPVEEPPQKRAKTDDSSHSPMQEPTASEPQSAAVEQAPLSPIRRKGLELLAYINQEIERGTLFWWQENPSAEPVLMWRRENQPGVFACPAFDIANDRFVIVKAPMSSWYFHKAFLSNITLSNTYDMASQQYRQVRLFLVDGKIFSRDPNLDLATDMANLLTEISVEKARIPPPPPPAPPSSSEQAARGGSNFADRFFDEVNKGLRYQSFTWRRHTLGDGNEYDILFKQSGYPHGPLWNHRMQRIDAVPLGGLASFKFIYTKKMFEEKKILVIRLDGMQPAMLATYNTCTAVYEIFPEDMNDKESLNKALHKVRPLVKRKARASTTTSGSASASAASSSTSTSVSAPAPVLTHLELYQNLGVENNATSNEITRAYRRLSLGCHPDRNQSEEAKAQWILISEAYAILGNEELRPVYDRAGMPGVRQVGQMKNFAAWQNAQL